MKNISLVIGDTCDLTQQIIEENKMIIVEYIVDWVEKDEVNGKNIYEKMRKSKTFPKTSQPSPWVFKNIFEQELKKDNEIFCITLSSKLSGGYNSALQAKSMFPEDSDQQKIFVFDSSATSGAEGLLCLRAAELIREGNSLKDIKDKLNEDFSKIYLIGMVEDPKWLEAGGRLNHTLASLIRQMLKINFRPVIGLKDGEVKAIALKTQARNIPEAIFKYFDKKTNKIRSSGKKIKVAISHTDNIEDINILRSLLNKTLGVEIVFENFINNVIGCHVGPGSLILSWSEI